MMELTIYNNAAESRIEAACDGGIAHLDYRIEGERMIVLYVEVPPSQRGYGIGGALAEAALQMAKEHNWTVIPVCSFMASYMQMQ
jgi:predicted GNAT family acetyltransferase